MPSGRGKRPATLGVVIGRGRKGLEEGARRLAKAYRVEEGSRFRLADHSPADTAGIPAGDRNQAAAALAAGIDLLSELQDKLYAQNQWAILLVFQAMDAAGKDGVIKHVLSGVNPQGCQVVSFKAPSDEELDHDFLWRAWKQLPERGRIGIFNRSYYEETLVVRVHPHLLQRQRIPAKLVSRGIWQQRYADINAMESYLSRNGTVVRKFFLHVSKEEQKRRFLERLERPQKNWKFSAADVREREHWESYRRAYEETIRHTATKQAPWHVVPADNKWFTRLVVAAVVIDALLSLKLRYPELRAAERAELARAREQLLESARRR